MDDGYTTIVSGGLVTCALCGGVISVDLTDRHRVKCPYIAATAKAVLKELSE